MDEIRKVLFIRRDNVGDMICTTPAIRGVRSQLPGVHIGVLANTYNAVALDGNPDVDSVHVYAKEKHSPDRSRLKVWAGNVKVIREIRRAGYDVAISCGTSFSKTNARYALLTGARRRVGYCAPGGPGFMERICYNVPAFMDDEQDHEVVRTYKLLKAIGITGSPGPMSIYPDRAQVEAAGRRLFKEGGKKPDQRPLLAIAISNRLERNRWPAEKFIALINRLLVGTVLEPVLFWTPGRVDDPLFPGDDEAAQKIMKGVARPITGHSSAGVPGLIAGLSLCDAVLTLDTGSLHMASALGKPTVALITEVKKSVWGPWLVDNETLAGDPAVAGIPVEDVFMAVNRIASRLRR